MKFIESELNDLGGTLGIKPKVEIQWEKIINHTSFTSTDKYIEMLDQVLTVSKMTLFSKYSGIQTAFPESVNALNNLTKISLFVDIDCKVRKSVGIYCPNFVVFTSEKSLIVQANYNYNQGYGCGMNLEWCLTPTLARMKEDRETDRLRQEEERRREDERRRDEERRREEEERKRQEENRKRDELDKKRRERCSYCKGVGFKECTWCYGVGIRKDNHKPCNFCGAKGSNKCSSCRGTGLQYPDL